MDDVGGFGVISQFNFGHIPSATLSPAAIGKATIRVGEVRSGCLLSNEGEIANDFLSLISTTLSFLTARLKSCGNSSEKLK